MNRIIDSYKHLESYGMLIPGTHIDKSLLMNLLNEKDENSISYKGPVIALCKKIQEKTGTFCRMIQNGIKIYKEDEGVFISKKRCKKSKRINNETYEVMIKTNQDCFSDQEKKMKHNHQINILLMLNKSTNLILNNE